MTGQPPATAQDTCGQIAYEAYAVQAGGVSLVSGTSLPSWHALPAGIREAWEAAGRAVLNSTTPEVTS